MPPMRSQYLKVGHKTPSYHGKWLTNASSVSKGAWRSRLYLVGSKGNWGRLLGRTRLGKMYIDSGVAGITVWPPQWDGLTGKKSRDLWRGQSLQGG